VGAGETGPLDGAMVGRGFGAGFAVEFTMTVFVVILGGAFLAFKAANDKGMFWGGTGPIADSREEWSGENCENRFRKRWN